MSYGLKHYLLSVADDKFVTAILEFWQAVGRYFGLEAYCDCMFDKRIFAAAEDQVCTFIIAVT